MIILVGLYDYHSMGIRGLHSWLESHKVDVESLFFYSSAYLDGVYKKSDVGAAIEWLVSQDPEYIGFGVRSPMLPLFKEFVAGIRKELPKCRVIIGGAHPTAVPEECTELADYVVPGEGENALLDILNGAPEGIVRGKPIEDLDSLPFVYYGERAHLHGGVYKINKLSYNSTRGCFFNCSYCQESLSDAPRRRMSVDKVSEDIWRLHELFPDVKVFTFSDSIFAHDSSWLKEFGDEFIGSRLLFWGNGFAPMLTGDMLQLLNRAGFNFMRIGVQSGSEYIRREIFNRKDSLDDVLKVAKLCDDRRFPMHYDFIIDNPYDTPETMKDTRDFISKLPPTAAINKFELRWWPGTPLTTRALDDGYITKEDVAGACFRVGPWSYVYQKSHGGL